MKKQQLLSLALLGLLFVSVGAVQAQAQNAVDELDYSACNCIPRRATQFQGSGSQGFEWDDRGFWLNSGGGRRGCSSAQPQAR